MLLCYFDKETFYFLLWLCNPLFYYYFIYPHHILIVWFSAIIIESFIILIVNYFINFFNRKKQFKFENEEILILKELMKNKRK